MIKVFAKTFDDATKEQIDKLGQSEAYRDCEIRVMPDAHVGAGCTIGTVIQIKDKVVPETVGVDIGCGMTVVKLGMLDLDLKRLDEIIKPIYNFKAKEQTPIWKELKDAKKSAQMIQDN